MDPIIYVCTGEEGKFLGAFKSRGLAEQSWQLSYSKAGMHDWAFLTEAGYWHVTCKKPNSTERIEVGRILCETVHNRAEHL